MVFTRIPSKELSRRVLAWQAKWRRHQTTEGPLSEEQKRQVEQDILDVNKIAGKDRRSYFSRRRSIPAADSSTPPKHFIWCDSPIVARLIAYDLRRPLIRKKINYFRKIKQGPRAIAGMMDAFMDLVLKPQELTDNHRSSLKKSLLKAFSDCQKTEGAFNQSRIYRDVPTSISLSSSLQKYYNRSCQWFQLAREIEKKTSIDIDRDFQVVEPNEVRSLFSCIVNERWNLSSIAADHQLCQYRWRHRVVDMDFHASVLGIKLNVRHLQLFEKVVASGVKWMTIGNMVFACEPRTANKYDEDYALHCEDGPSLAYADGTELYAIHGVVVPKRVVMTPHKLRIKEIQEEGNTEIRRVMLERFGVARFLEEARCHVVDKRIDPLTGFPEVLYHLGDQVGHSMFECTDPSTGRVYHLSVPTNLSSHTCVDAQRWMSLGLHDHITHRT